MQNKYYIRSRISEAKFREIVRYFSYDIDATQISKLTKISRNSVNKILGKIRERIFSLSVSQKKDSENLSLMRVILELRGLEEKEEGELLEKHLYLAC